MKRQIFQNAFAGLASVTLALGLASMQVIAESDAPSQVLFKNVSVFNGKDDKLLSGRSVLVEGNLIKSVSSSDISAPAGATVIDGGGKTLMPGLIDGHAHLMINSNYGVIEVDEDPYDLGIKSVKVVEAFLMDGFTSVRDMGGPTFALKRQIEKGSIIGPRVYPAGAFISQTPVMVISAIVSTWAGRQKLARISLTGRRWEWVPWLTAFQRF